MKKCFKCKRDMPLSSFYKHSRMADGHLNKCKECTKKDATAHREENIERIRAYDRARGCRKNPGYAKEYRAKYPNKYRAHNMVNNAIRSGKLFPEPCWQCGHEKAIAHHDDYLKPLSVRWVCQVCHCQWHRDNGEARNP